MAQPDNYEVRRHGRWTLRVRPEIWSDGLWAEIRDRISETASNKHPRTLRLGAGYYLKIYSPPRGATRIKDAMRNSKAMRALNQTDALSRLGFHAPPVVAAGRSARAAFWAALFSSRGISTPGP